MIPLFRKHVFGMPFGQNPEMVQAFNTVKADTNNGKPLAKRPSFALK